MTKPSKPRYQPVLDNGRGTFSVIKGPINGDNCHETVFYRPLHARMSIAYLFQEIDHFAEEAVQEGEVAPEEKEELIRRSRNAIATWFTREH